MILSRRIEASQKRVPTPGLPPAPGDFVLKRLAGLLALFMLAFAVLAHRGVLARLFSSNYVPHRYCYLTSPGLVWTNVIMDGLIGVSYAVIFAALFWIAARLRAVPDLRSYLWIFLSFGLFIAACGATHFMEIVTVWVPVYPLSAAVKVVCAAASVPTAILFTLAAPRLAAAMRRFLEMLSTTRQEKDQAVLALIASEKLAVAGRLSATITHEVRNPLDTANNLLYLVTQDPRMPADLVQTLATATAELERASNVARSTLGLYQQSGKPVPVLLGELVDSVLDLQELDLVQRGVALHRRLRTPVPLQAYPGELRQVLINLIQNASAALPSGAADGQIQDGQILVRVQPRHMLTAQVRPARTGRMATVAAQSLRLGRPGYSITVADNGSGIRPEDRARLFTLFFTTKGEQGTGLGLWLVRSMVEKQGGRIVFRSRTAAESATHGTLFNIWIPLEAAQVAGPASEETLASHQDGEGARRLRA